MVYWTKAAKAHRQSTTLMNSYRKGALNSRSAITKMIELGRDLPPLPRHYLLHDILSLTLEAMEKEKFHPAQAINTIKASVTALNLRQDQFLQSVLIPHAEDNADQLQSSTPTRSARVLQTLFYNATSGQDYHDDRVDISQPLGIYYADICIVFQKATHPFAIAEERAMPLPDMINYMKGSSSAPQNETRKNYLDFLKNPGFLPIVIPSVSEGFHALNP